MSSGRVKVVGYTQKTYYNGGIEYRNFTDDLVGAQQTSNVVDGLPFSFSNIFDIEFNNEGRLTKTYVTNKFSNFVTLTDIDLSNIQVQELIGTDSKLYLNADKTLLTNYAYFGSLREFIRVSLENIILTWPASIFLNNTNGLSQSINTIENYNYDLISDSTTFKVNVNNFSNPYGIDYTIQGAQLSGHTYARSLVVSYLDSTNIIPYVISASTGQFNITEFTGATNIINDYVYFKIDGNPFPVLSNGSNGSIKYHIKPSVENVEKFYNQLNDFEAYLLNRYSVPQNKAVFNLKMIHDAGNIVYGTKSFIWPVNDGYNLDFQSNDYITYVQSLIELTDEMDEQQTDILTRFLVPNSITEFDSIRSCDGEIIESEGQKITKTLRIYGREFDEIKKYTDGIQFSHTVSYDKKDNIPDGLIKTLAQTLGWELTNSILSDDTLTSYLPSDNTLYSGHSKGYSAFQSEIEFWRRLVINTPWIWKSKGTRKAVEFLIKFIGCPEGLIEFNEYVYVAQNQIDMDLFREVQLKINNTTNISDIPISNDGYPSPLKDTSNLYFQKAGLWYRETAGTGSTLDKLVGNNPHIGPYDGGDEYISQFGCLIPNFTPVTITEESIYTATTNLFTNYNGGTFNDMFSYDAVATCALTIDPKYFLINGYNHCMVEYGAQYSGVTSCSYSGDWSFNIYIDDNLVYNGDSIYQTNKPAQYPALSAVTAEIISAAATLGLEVEVSGKGNVYTFVQTSGFGLCESPSLINSTIRLDLCLDITLDCGTAHTITGSCQYCNTVCDIPFEERGTTEEIYIDVFDANNNNASDCYEITMEGIEDPFPLPELTDCGCDESGCDNALRICIRETQPEVSTISDCGIVAFTLNENGYVSFDTVNNKTTFNISSECCKSIGFTPTYIKGNWQCRWATEELVDNLSSDLVCDDLVVYDIDDDGNVTFKKDDKLITIFPDKECCKAFGFYPKLLKGGYKCIKKK